MTLLNNIQTLNMARIDPVEILKGLSGLLGQSGNVKQCEDVTKIVELMKGADTAVSQCTYTNILRATTDSQVLETFVKDGGWDILNKWLEKYKETENYGMLIELLKVYKQIPVSVDLLKKNSCAKSIKNLSKSCNDSRIKEVAMEIVNLWMKAIKSTSGEVSSSDKAKKKKKEKAKEKEKSEKMDKTNAENKDSKSNLDRRPSNSNNNHSKQDSRDIASSQDIKSRPKTVKVYQQKFRSHGLEEQAKIVPKRKGDTDKNKNSNKKEDQLSLKRASDHLKSSTSSQPQEKKPRPVLPSIPSAINHANKPSTVDFGKIKIIPPRPKPVHESTGFMDALATAKLSAPLLRKARRKEKKPRTPTSPNIKVPSFYKDTLDTDDKAMSPDADKKDGNLEDVEMKSEASGDTDSLTGSTSSLTNKKKKRKVSWAVDSKLTAIRYFEIDDSERVNVNHINFQEMKKKEMLFDQQAIQTVKHLHDTNGVSEDMVWRRPERIDLSSSAIERGCNSKEKDIQGQRELGVLLAIYFSKESIPDTATEPDLDPYKPSKPTVIPLDDVLGSDDIVYGEDKGMPFDANEPQPVLHPGDQFSTNNSGSLSLPTNVQNLLTSIVKPGSSADTIEVDKLKEILQNVPQLPPGVTGGHQTEMGLLGNAPETAFPIMGQMDMQGQIRSGWAQAQGPMFQGRGIRMPFGAPTRAMRPPPPAMMAQMQQQRFLQRNASAPTTICRHFMTGGCRFGIGCHFLHPGVNGPMMPGFRPTMRPLMGMSPPHSASAMSPTHNASSSMSPTQNASSTSPTQQAASVSPKQEEPSSVPQQEKTEKGKMKRMSRWDSTRSSQELKLENASLLPTDEQNGKDIKTSTADEEKS